MSSPRGTRIANAALGEEIDSVNAIYGSKVAAAATSVAGSSSNNNNPNGSQDSRGAAADDDHLVLQMPGQSVSFLLSFPHDYPDSCPRAEGTQSTGQLGKGQGQAAVELVRHSLDTVWTPGSVCLFDLIEEAGPLLVQLQQQQRQRQDGAGGSKSGGRGVATIKAEESESVAQHLRPEEEEEERARCGGQEDARRIPAADWSVSDAITEKKSVFVARCARVSDKAGAGAGAGAATSLLADLLATNKKVAAATHNISAWRMRMGGERGVTVQDCDDDGETAAGARLLRLMQLMDVWDAVVVVSRWYGGVKLGPDRFRLINQAAREALLRAGFGEVGEEEKRGKGGKKRGKK
ncbi:hypothetical protein GJ744_008346 [Endocarpon pusillum]|uniref:RWD domain-containing protein n=1 Tax=Endocarpon pusillum TaxID=364733 RepID=A0A8H7AKK7_9EURO|nr:hypothetical protein GJ744_008346 [Endocarpon pusillum]